MLSSRATIGEYQKKRRVQGREVKIGPPIPNYYPSVIDESLFEAARLARIGNLAERRGRKGRDIANLFAGIAHCWYCGAAIRFLSRGKYKYLVCSRRLWPPWMSSFSLVLCGLRALIHFFSKK